MYVKFHGVQIKKEQLEINVHAIIIRVNWMRKNISLYFIV